MVDLFSYSPLTSTYASIYGSLNEMKEIFHRTGRFDDSNAKLDEVAKLIAVYVSYRQNRISHFPSSSSKEGRHLIESLHRGFSETVELDIYRNQDGSSIFGPNPRLALREGDEELAIILVSLVRNAVDAALTNRELDQPLDVLNEAFGHFVRDNFRSHIEDAQYMTPPEVVDFMVRMALKDLENEHSVGSRRDPLVVSDPTCGVGSFLTHFYHEAQSSAAMKGRPIRIVGQDKVERMVRLTKINLALFEAVDSVVTIGNSLANDSTLTELNGTVDLVLTNPPFGATFGYPELSAAGPSNLPIFAPICHKLPKVDSALLFIDRNLALLRDGGRLLIVVPDYVISAKGTAALLRQQLKSRALVRAIIELPSVTFAQAGTRTKTCILYLVKQPTDSFDGPVFLAKSEYLGFDVISRKGTQVKVLTGSSDLINILDAYSQSTFAPTANATEVLLERPSCVLVKYDKFVDNSWTPNHYNTSRLKSLNQISKAPDTMSVPLSHLVDFHSEKRASERLADNGVFISVLHIIGEGMLDVNGILKYRPKTPGIRVNPGEILFSRINPRIPRVLVMPDFGKKTLCSSEFEIMSSRPGVDPYLVAYLLQSASVQDQIRSLTSGTSASHNRIKTRDLAQVLIPLAKPGTDYERGLKILIGEYRQAVTSLIVQALKLVNIREEEEKLRIVSS